MTLPWSPQQVEWLQAMGLEVLGRSPAPIARAPGSEAAADGADIPAGLRRAARGVDLGLLVATLGVPRDAASRRAFWRALRPLRRSAAIG